MIQPRARRQRRQRGSVLVLSAALMMILIGFVGLVVDGGEVSSEARSTQNAADAAALGAGYYITNQGDSLANATSLGQTLATQNGMRSLSDLTLTYTDGSGAVTAVPANVRNVQADITHSFATLFLPILGIDSAQVSVHAKVQVTPAQTAGCALCVLAASGTAVTVTGSGLWVQNAPIGINSTSAGALTVASGLVYQTTSSGVPTPAITIQAPGTAIGCVGFACSPAPSAGGAIGDPLSGMALPGATLTNRGDYQSGNSGTPQTILPGMYGKLRIHGGDQVTMSPGLYVVTDSFVDDEVGSGKLIATGVTIYLACASYPAPCSPPGQAGAYFDYSGTNQILQTGQTGGEFQGMAIMFDRNNTGAFNITSNSWFNIAGTVYAPRQNLTINSTSGTAVVVYSRFIVNTVAVTSAAILYVQYNGSNNYTIPGTLKLQV